MNFLLQDITIISPDSPHHGKTLDIHLQDGTIKSIGKDLEIKEATIKTWDNAHISIGWMDMGALIGDPGFEHREDLESATQAAAFGGFTAVACQPNTLPVVHSKSEVLYIKRQLVDNIVDFHPIGAISKDCGGLDITEMYDMKKAGAIAFSDGLKSLQHSGVMMRALLYVKPFDGVIINQAKDKTIGGAGLVHEGYISTTLGLKGMPALAEELMVQRDIYLTEYTDGRLHIANISTQKSVELVRAAKAKGLKITASVNPMNLTFKDEVVTGFDSNYKVMPPLREDADITALKEGLKDGTIDAIQSHHIPHDEEGKNLEFMYAEFGTIGLETAYAASNTVLQNILDIRQLVEKMAINPRKIFNLDIPKVEEGAIANLTIFDPTKEWVFQATDIKSKSKNTPFVNTSFKGKAIAVINNKQFLEQK